MSDFKEQMAISKFKATCLAVLKRVRETGRPVVVTRFGEAIAEVIPPALPERGKGWLGALRSEGRIVGDLIEPSASPDEWEALRG